MEFATDIPPEAVPFELTSTMTMQFMAGKVMWFGPALFFAVEGLWIAMSAVTASEARVAGFAAGFAAVGLLTDKRMPECVEGPASFA